MSSYSSDECILVSRLIAIAVFCASAGPSGDVASPCAKLLAKMMRSVLNEYVFYVLFCLNGFCECILRFCAINLGFKV